MKQPVYKPLTNKQPIKRTLIGAFLSVSWTLVFISSSAFSADIFVRTARGPNLNSAQKDRMTDMVKRAIRRMPEHNLVQSEAMADFVLQPSVIHRDNHLALRVEKYKDGELLAQNEQIIPSLARSGEQVFAATDTAIQEDRIASAPVSTDLPDTTSATTSSPSGTWSQSNTANNNTIDSGNAESRHVNRADDGASPAPARHSTVNNSASDSSMQNSGTTSATSTDSSAGAMTGGDVRAPSPMFQRTDRWGVFQLGVGPSFSTGLGSDNMLYDINFGYAVPMNEMFAGKAFADLNLNNGSDASRFIEIGLGGEVYPWGQMSRSAPYFVGDLGYAFTRDVKEQIQDAPAIGAGAGFKFAAQELNMDVNLHYTVLTAQLQGRTPTVLGIRAALNF